MVDAEGSEDVNDFLQRIRELGDKRDKEDEERTRRLEEDILQGRKERQARRAERARSISPTKESPSNVNTSRLSPRIVKEPQALEERSPESSPSERSGSDMVSRAGAGVTPIRDARMDKNQPLEGAGRSTNKPIAPSSQTSSSSLGRTGTLSWQQRPTSRGSGGAKSRPLSVVAAENNRLKSPRGTPELETSSDTDLSRGQIAQSLASKDPSWFKQTQDRGLGSVAFRKNQDESKPESWVAHGNLRLPGMSRESTAEPEKESNPRPESVPLSSQSQEGSARGSSSWSQRYVSNASSALPGLAMPTMNSQRLEPPGPNAVVPLLSDTSSSHEPVLQIPQSGRTSPDRGDRPASPTKGLGGFVQSAMLKRSDSQNKRWNAQAGSLSRGNSTVSNRSGHDGSRAVGRSSSPPRDRFRSSLTRESSPESSLRSHSTHGQTTSFANIAVEKPTNSTSIGGRPLRGDDGFIRPDLPEHSRSSFKGTGKAPSPPLDRSDISPPSSPTKTADPKRWSPQKASWLESALNKPESPKPTVSTLTQPSWLADLGKAKPQRSSGGHNKAPGFKEVATSGLLRSPPMGTGFRSPGIDDLASRPSSRTAGSGASASYSLSHSTSLPNPAKSEETLPHEVKVESPREDDHDFMEKLRPTKSEVSRPKEAIPQKPSKPSTLESKLSPPSNKPKPITPPKKDFRANLKPRQEPGVTKGDEEVEFRNVFGKLKRTETKNYKAPDELKDNILRGKAGLAVTGGPKKNERRDQFKESILKKKEEMKVGPGVTTTRKTSVPSKAQPDTSEDFAPTKGLGRSLSKTENRPSETRNASGPSDAVKPEESHPSIMLSPPPQQVPSKVAPAHSEKQLNGKLAGRFNPALAGLLSRGPPPTSGSGPPGSSSPISINDVGKSSVAADNDASSNSGQLTHMTKGRARGPKRKAPKAVVQDDTPKTSEPERQLVEKKTPIPSHDTTASTKSTPQHPSLSNDQDGSKSLSNIRDISKNEAPPSVTPKAGTIVNQSDVSLGSRPTTQKPPQSSLNPKATTFTAPKSPGVRKPSSQIARPLNPTLEAKSNDVANEQGMIPKGLDKDTTTESNGEPQKKMSLISANPPQTVQAVSVSNAAARWSGNLEKNTRQAQSPKSPIKLPTRHDEAAAHKEAGLSDRQAKGTVGLGIRPLPTPPAKSSTIQPNLNIFSTPSQKISPSTPAKKSDLTANKSISNGIADLVESSSLPPKSSPSNPIALLNRYFGNLPPPTNPIDINTPKVLESRRQPDTNKIKTLRKQIWQVTPDGRKASLAPQQEHILYEDNMYLCTHVFGSVSGTRTTEVYLWHGDDVSSAAVEDAQLFSRKVAKEHGGKLILLRQGKETSEFFQALGGIVITRKNRSGSYVLCGRRHVGQIAFDEVPLSSASLCSGFPYIVSASSGKLYLWKGTGAGADELGCARLIGMDLGVTGEIEEVDEGNESRTFWEVFPEKKAALDPAQSAEYWKEKPSLEKHATRLFSVEIETRPKSSGASGFAMWGRRGSTPGPVAESSFASIREVQPYTQDDLEGDAVFVLDTFFELFIILPQTSSTLKPSPRIQNFRTALFFAQEYGILAVSEDDRPFVPRGTVVLTGAPHSMRSAFRKWNAGLVKPQDSVTMPLGEALDAMRE